MRSMTIFLLNLAAVLLGLSMALSQTNEAAVSLGSAQAAASARACRSKYVFVLFHKGDDAATRTVWQILEAALAKRADQAIAVNVRVNDPAMKTVVDRYGVGCSPLPLVFAIAPNGEVKGSFAVKLTGRNAANAFIGPDQEVYSMKKLKQRILFVCVENSNRSQMAEAFARLHGGDCVEAHSAGSRPSGQINPRAVQFMREIGYDLTAQKSKSLDSFNGTEIDVAVTMGCGDACPLVRAGRREEWNIPDPKELSDDEFREVRDWIEGKVQELLASL